MTAEQLLEQMETFEKAKNDFDEFEKSHQSAFKGFLNSFGFTNEEINQIISGNINIKPEDENPDGTISAKNRIIELFKIYNEITALQKEKIELIIKNADDSVVENSKTIHFENLANAINAVPMDYYRKVYYTNEAETTTETTKKNSESSSIDQSTNQSKQEQAQIQIGDKKHQANNVTNPQQQQIKQSDQKSQQAQQKQNAPVVDKSKPNKAVNMVFSKSNTNAGQKIGNNIQIPPNNSNQSQNQRQNKPNQNLNQKQNKPNQNNSGRQNNQGQNQNNYTRKNNQGQRQNNQGQWQNNNNNPAPNQQQRYNPKHTPPSNQGSGNTGPTTINTQKPTNNLTIQKPSGGGPTIQRPSGGGPTIQMRTKTGKNLFDKT